MGRQSSFDEDISDRIRTAKLLDLYGKLLTDNQLNVMTHYYFDNLSLAEIAQNLSVSRQAVYDHIKKSKVLLNKYEDKLNFMERFGV